MASDIGRADLLPDIAASDSPAERLSRGGGWMTAVLALVMLVSVVGAVDTANWADGLVVLQPAVLGGAVLGFLLAISGFDGLFCALYSFLASVPWIATLVMRALLNNPSLHDGIAESLRRNFAWFSALYNGGPSSDNFIFVTQLCFLGWWMGYFAFWSLFRYQRVFHAIVPAGCALLFNAYFAPTSLATYTVIYFISVLLLAMRVELARNEMRWQNAQIRYAPDILIDFLRAGVIFAVAVTALAWSLPRLTSPEIINSAFKPFEKPWHDLGNTWSRMYTSLNYPRVAVQRTAFEKSKAFGGPVSLTNRPILDAYVRVRSYWQAEVFDMYSGQGWTNTDDEVASIPGGQPLGEPHYALAKEVTATIRPLETGQDVLFGAPHPERVSRPVNAEVDKLPAGAGSQSVSMLRSATPLRRDEAYQVVSRISSAADDLLRKDGAAYPEWIAGRYLQLPPDFPPQVSTLARQIAAPYDNPFDKASAIENFLRQYPYSQQIAPPPAGVDGVEYFLFDVKEGYCDYYASAMTTMLRAVGVPARLVVGYTPGEEVGSSEGSRGQAVQYRVLERNAHAWPEAYFPTYGWIQFEPTASEPLLTRSETAPKPVPAPTPAAPGNLDEPNDIRGERGNPQDLAPLTPQGPVSWIQARRVGVATAGLAAIVALFVGMVVYRRRSARSSASDVLGHLFDHMGTWAARLHIPWRASQTPLERASGLSEALPAAQPAIDGLATLFVAQQYGRQQPAGEELARVSAGWRGVQHVLWGRWVTRLFKKG